MFFWSAVPSVSSGVFFVEHAGTKRGVGLLEIVKQKLFFFVFSLKSLR